MSKLFWNALKASPFILGGILISCYHTNAQTAVSVCAAGCDRAGATLPREAQRTLLGADDRSIAVSEALRHVSKAGRSSVQAIAPELALDQTSVGTSLRDSFHKTPHRDIKATLNPQNPAVESDRQTALDLTSVIEQSASEEVVAPQEARQLATDAQVADPSKHNRFQISQVADELEIAPSQPNTSLEPIDQYAEAPTDRDSFHETPHRDIKAALNPQNPVVESDRQTALDLSSLIEQSASEEVAAPQEAPQVATDAQVADPSKHNRFQISQVADELEIAPSQPNTSLEPIDQYTEAPNEGMEQVTSVSQLRDVQQTDWAFQALQNLVERYGCIAGYPDGTFRGNRAMTRYEFAAGLNACLETLTQLIGGRGENFATQEDLALVNRLLQEFQAELATLRERVDTLEARAAFLETNQFSTTTKLNGLIIFAANGGTIRGETGDRPDPNPTAFSYMLLNLRTSFTGSDQLLTQLFAGSGSPVDEATKTTPAILSFLDYSGVGTDVALRRLRYTFPLFENLTASVFLRGNVSDFVDFNSYANDSLGDFSTTSFLFNLLLIGGDATGAGAALTWNPGEGPLTLKAVYRADAAASPTRVSPDSRGGVFGDPNLAVFEAEFIPSKSFGLRLNYSLGSQGGADYSAIGGNFEFAPFQGIALFGRFAHAFDYIDVIGAGVRDTGANPTSWMAGISFPNVLGEGTLAGFAVGQPFIENSLGDVTQLNMEAFYRFPLNDNVTITPLVQVIVNPGNLSSSGTLYTGTLRMSFSF